MRLSRKTDQLWADDIQLRTKESNAKFVERIVHLESCERFVRRLAKKPCIKYAYNKNACNAATYTGTTETNPCDPCSARRLIAKNKNRK